MNPQNDPPTGDNPVSPQPEASSGPQVIGPQQSAPNSSFNPNPVASTAPQPLQPLPNGPAPLPASPLAPKRRMPGKKLLAIFGAVLILGLGGGVLAYVQIMNNSSEKVLADALSGTMADLLDRKPSKAVGTITVESKDESQPFKLHVDMDVKSVDKKGQFKADVDFTMDKMQFSVTGTTISEGSKTFYLKLDNLEKTFDQILAQMPADVDPVTAPKYKAIIKKLDGKWIKIDEQSIEEMGFTSAESDLNKCTDAIEKLRISKDDQKQIKKIFTTHQFAIASEELPSEEVEGDTSFHYKLNLNEEAAVLFTKQLIELPSFKTVKEDCGIKTEELDKTIEDIKKDVEQQTDKEETSKPVLELWVSKETRRPTKFKVTFNDKEVSFEDITVVKIDAPNITVDIPTETMSIKEVMEMAQQELGIPVGSSTLGWSDLREQVITQ